MNSQPQTIDGRTSETIGPLKNSSQTTETTYDDLTATTMDNSENTADITAKASSGIAHFNDSPAINDSDFYFEDSDDTFGFETYYEDNKLFPEVDLTQFYYQNPDSTTIQEQITATRINAARRTYSDNVHLYSKICFIDEDLDYETNTIWDIPFPMNQDSIELNTILVPAPLIVQQSDTNIDEVLGHDVFNAIMTNSKYREEHTYLEFQPRVQYSLNKEERLWTVTIVGTIQRNTKEYIGVASTRKAAKLSAITVFLNSVLKRTDTTVLSQVYLFTPDKDTGLQVTTMLKAYNEFLQLREKTLKWPELSIWQQIGLLSHNVETTPSDNLTSVEVSMRFCRETTSYKGTFVAKPSDVRAICANITFEECLARNMGVLLDWLLSRNFLNTGKRLGTQQSDTAEQQADTEAAFAVLSTTENTVAAGPGATLETTDEPQQTVVVAPAPRMFDKLVHEDESVRLSYAEAHMLPILTYVLTEPDSQTVTPFVFVDILESIFQLVPNIQLTMFTRTLLSRPKLHITIKLNATYVYQGRLIAEIMPQVGQLLVYNTDNSIDYVRSRITVDDMIKRQATQFDIAASTDITLTMDFIDVLNAINNREEDNLIGYAHLLVGSVTPLRTGPDETATLTLNIYAHLDNTEFMQRTFPISDSNFRKKHRIRARQEMMALAAGALGTGLLKKPAENLLGPITNNLGAWIGKIVPKPASEKVPDTRKFDRDVTGDYARDRPEVPMAAVHIKPTYTDNLAIGLGEEQTMSMRLNPATEQQIQPNQTTPILDMVEIAQAPSRFTNIVVTPTAVSQQKVLEQLISYSGFPGTNMQYAMEMFALIRSSVRIKLQYIKPMGLQGSLMLTFVPGVTTATFAEARNCKTHTVDLRDIDETEFVIPFWSTTVARSYSDDPTLGIFQVWIIVPITAPSITSQKLDIVGYVAAGDDCELTALTSQSQATSSYAQQSMMTEYLLNETHSHIAHILSRYNAIGSTNILSSGGFDLTTAILTGDTEATEKKNAITKILKLFKYMNTSFDILFEALPLPPAQIKSQKLLAAQSPITIGSISSPPAPIEVLSFTPFPLPAVSIFTGATLSNGYTTFPGSNDGDVIQAPGTGNQVRHSPYNTAATNILTLDFVRNGRTCTSNNNLVAGVLANAATLSSQTRSLGTAAQTNIDRIKTASDSNLALNQYTISNQNVDLGQTSAIESMVTQINSNVVNANDTNASLQTQINNLSGDVQAISSQSSIVDIAYSPPTSTVVPFTGVASQKINTAINPSMNLFVPKMNRFARLPTFVRGRSTDGVRSRMLEASTLGKFIFNVTNPVKLNMYTRLSDGKQLSWFLGAPSQPTVSQQADFDSMQHDVNTIAHEAAATGSQVATIAEVHNAPIEITAKKSLIKKIKHGLSPTHTITKNLNRTITGQVDPLLDKIETTMTDISGSVQTLTSDVGKTCNTATNLLSDAAPLPGKLSQLADSVTSLVDSVKSSLLAAATKLTSFFDVTINVDMIISCLISLVIGIVNPNPLTITLTVLNTLLTLGIVCSKTLKKLITFFTNKLNSKPSISSETRNEIVGVVEQQCSHACPKCVESTECGQFCNLCKELIFKDEKAKLFNADDKVFLTTTLIGGLSAVVGYCGKPKHIPMTTRLWDTSLNFWRTLPGISMFIRNLLEFVKKLCNRLLHKIPENKAIKILQDADFLVKFHTKITRLSNPSVQQDYITTPAGRRDFIETHLQAQKILSKLVVVNHPQLTQLIVDLKKFIEFSGKKAKQIIVSETGHAPFSVMIFGPSGIGKSYNMEHYAYAAMSEAKKRSLLELTPNVYHHTDLVEFWNRYEGQPCLKFDELFPTNSKEELAKRVQLLMSLISDTVQNANKADLADKHDVIQASLLITGTNTPFFEKLPSEVPNAFYRRFEKIGMRFKINDRLRSLGKEPNTIQEVISSNVSVENIAQRVISHKEFLPEERDDMYEFLYFHKNLSNNVSAGREMYDRHSNGEAKWISQTEFLHWLKENYCESLVARQAKIEKELSYRAEAMGETYNEEHTNLEKVLHTLLVSEQIKIIQECKIDEVEQQVLFQNETKILSKTPEQFADWIDQQQSKFIGTCSKCCESQDDSTKQLVLFCSRRYFKTTAFITGPSKLTPHRCDRGLCAYHLKVLGKTEAIKHFTDHKNCDCESPKIATSMSELGVFNYCVRSIQHIVNGLEMSALSKYERIRRSSFWTVMGLLTGGLSHLASFPLTLRLNDFPMATENGVVYLPIVPQEQIPIKANYDITLPLLKESQCQHVIDQLNSLDSQARYTFVRSSDERPYYLVERADQPDIKIPYLQCNTSCKLPDFRSKLLALWKEEHPKWQTMMNNSKCLTSIPIELIPHTIDRAKYGKHVNWFTKIKNTIMSNLTRILTVLGTITIALTGIFGCYSLFQMWQDSRKESVSQQAYTTKGVRSIKRGIPNGALRNIKIVEQQSPQAEIIQDTIMTNIVTFNVDDTAIYSQGLCLRDRVVLLPFHCFRVLERSILAKRSITVGTMYGKFKITTFKAWKPPVFTQNGWEFAVLYIREIPQHTNVIKHIQTKLGHEFTPFETVLLHKHNGTNHQTSSKIHCFSTGPLLSTGALGDEILKNYYVTSTSLKGACGGVYALPAQTHPKPLAFAMHFAGSQFQEGFALPLIREMLDEVATQMIAQATVQQQGINDHFDELEIVAKLHDPIYIPDKTKRRPSLISKLLEKEGLKCETFPSILSAKDPRFDAEKLGYSTPLMGGILEHGTNPSDNFDQGLVDYAVECWSKHYIEKAPPYTALRSSYTAEEAIRGIRCGDTLVLKGMDLSTSIGVGGFYRDKTRTTKKHYITFDENDVLHMDADMVTELEEQLVERQNGQAFGSIFMDQLKDELRTKLTTRTFSGSECVLTIITRMMKGPFITATTLNHLKLRTAIGMDSTSLEWDHLARDLLEHDHYLAGDFKAFGPRIPRNVVEGSGKVAEKWFEYYFPQRDTAETKIMQSCHQDICPALHVANALVYLAPGGIPSGHPTTTLDNTISHQIMDFVIYMEIMQSSPETLKYADFESYMEHIRLWTLGDDEIKSISSEIAPFYDGLKISEAYAKYNVIFTDAQKKGNVKFDKWTDLEFLKSSFVRHPNRQIWIARMRMTTVISTAHWIHKTDDEPAMTAQNAEQSLALAWGWGPEKYEELRSIYHKCLKKVGIYQPLRSYNELDFMIKSRTYGNVNGVFGPTTTEDEHDQHMINITFDELNVGMRTYEDSERSENSPVDNTECYQYAIQRSEIKDSDLSVCSVIA